MTHKNEKYFRYVPYHREKAYEACGWEYSGPLGPPHCAYASLYEWTGNGEPVEPAPDNMKIDMEIKNGKQKRE